MSKDLNKAPVEQAGGDERDLQAEGAQEVPSPVSQEYDRHLISLLRKGEALPGHQEEAADEIERLRDWNDHMNNTVLPNILNPNFLMLMKGGERLLDLCTKDGKFIGVSLNDMKDVFDWMVTHARIAPDHAALAQPSPVSEALIYACKNLAQITSSDGSGHADIAMAVLRMAGVGDDERERLVNEWKAARAWKPSPAQAEKAEAERQEVVDFNPYRYHAEKIRQRADGAASAYEAGRSALGYMEDIAESALIVRNGLDELSAQHERITAKLHDALDESDGDRWKMRSERDAANARLHEVATACATAEQERDAALARVAELEMILRELNTSGLMQFSTADEEKAVRAALSGAQAQHSVPDDVETFLDEVRAELLRARSKFPGDRIMTIALAEEFGELCKAVLDEPAANVRKEAVQTAVMAARVVLDGDGSVTAWRAERGLDPLAAAPGKEGL